MRFHSSGSFLIKLDTYAAVRSTNPNQPQLSTVPNYRRERPTSRDRHIIDRRSTESLAMPIWHDK